MQTWTKAKNNHEFWHQIAAAPGLLLMFDYDGTLAPFTTERDKAWPYAGVREALRTLVSLPDIHVAIVTGRTCAEIPSLLGLDADVEIWGCHGGERKSAGGSCHKADLSPDLTALIESAYNKAAALIAPENIERKPFSVAVHVRSLQESRRKATLQAVCSAWASLPGYLTAELLPFACGLELRVAGYSKARAVTALLQEHPQAAAFYVGDDKTDEDAFSALIPFLQQGVPGAAVLAAVKPDVESAAQWILSPPQELLEFLAFLAAARS
ncbi:trehalose-phosphatase [Oleidesulfovibrio sp.]|uniref:trehalose-phosphatase n=1 Tax=Oleidesulfovibrio sp. TaxID=2909707 RepID=UPI003A8C5B04